MLARRAFCSTRLLVGLQVIRRAASSSSSSSSFQLQQKRKDVLKNRNNVQRSVKQLSSSDQQQDAEQKGNKREGALQLIKRPPVVTIMGHVDHGKTTLLDYLRNSQIVKQEFGGITQHIGAFIVPFKNKTNETRELVTFLDTPGHAAFASMRQRGANITDIVVLVVACEDGVLDQTVESIRYAKNSNVPIIVAINKVDKFASSQQDLDRQIRLIRSQLIVHDVTSELDSGDVQLVKISALKGLGIDDLKEAILALSETLELRAPIDCLASGHVIESLVDPHRGKLCTILVDQGQIRKGSVLMAGTNNWAKVRALFDERGKLQQSCGPGQPIQITGWREDALPSAGDPVVEMSNESEAKSAIHKFRLDEVQEKAEEDAQQAAKRYEQFYQIYREKLNEKRDSGHRYGRIFFTPRGQRPKESQEDEMSDRKINMILKCDVDGSLDAMLDLLDTYDKDQRQPVKLDLMHYGVGAITETDYQLAASFSNSVIYGFNVKPASQKILLDAKRDGVSIKLFNVIYHLVDDLKQRLADKIPEQEQEQEIGRALVLQEFIVTETNKKKTRVAGCRCSRGSLKRSGVLYKLVRNQETIVQDLQVKTLKHLKEEVKEIEKERECGISFVDELSSGSYASEQKQQAFEFKPGDLLICYEKFKVKPKLKWDIRGFT